MPHSASHHKTHKAETLLFDAITKRRVGRSTCFLCGVRLGARNRSDEHVIPDWAQRRFNIASKQMHLLNGSTITYKNLVVPCCRNCNNRFLKPIEDKVATAQKKGYAAFKKLDDHTLFIWLGKIFYGLLYREYFLKQNIRNPRSRKIVPRSLLRRFETHHYLLQSVRVPMKFAGAFPASIYVYRCQSPKEPELQWDFRDNVPSMFISIRMGSVGVIAVLQDGGAQHSLPEPLRFKTLELHPLQFMELTAKVMYKSTLFDRVPKFILIDGNPATAMLMPVGGLSNKPIYRDWDQKTYAHVLHMMLGPITGISLEQMWAPPDMVWSCITNSNGGPNRLRWKDWYWTTRQPASS